MQFTRFEIARIIGARALQLSMDAPILLKLSKEELEELNYNVLEIARRELEEGVLPIAVHRPTPKKVKEKLREVKEEEVSDEELIEKEKEGEKEILKEAKEYGFISEDDEEEEVESTEEEE
ncbi:DNA-directed RNA polymerase subunit K [Candidatus Pacearchaeota archaeon]|nr:MAG: DNA-directed RNA polymerase subunit K [Candidatus Pacearchaeota archaeon]